jgi:hypothetical protein
MDAQRLERPAMSIENIENTGEAFNLDHKRFYIPITVTAKCPHCGLMVTKNLASETGYLSYPKLNVPFDLSMYHVIEHDEGMRDEEHDWKVSVILRVALEAAEDPT